MRGGVGEIYEKMKELRRTIQDVEVIRRDQFKRIKGYKSRSLSLEP